MKHRWSSLWVDSKGVKLSTKIFERWQWGKQRSAFGQAPRQSPLSILMIHRLKREIVLDITDLCCLQGVHWRHRRNWEMSQSEIDRRQLGSGLCRDKSRLQLLRLCSINHMNLKLCQYLIAYQLLVSSVVVDPGPVHARFPCLHANTTASTQKFGCCCCCCSERTNKDGTSSRQKNR
jgi:hypothetical protein